MSPILTNNGAGLPAFHWPPPPTVKHVRMYIIRKGTRSDPHLSGELGLGFEGTAITAFRAAVTAALLSLWLRISLSSLLMVVSGSQPSSSGFCSSAACSKLLALEMCTPTGLPQACT